MTLDLEGGFNRSRIVVVPSTEIVIFCDLLDVDVYWQQFLGSSATTITINALLFLTTWNRKLIAWLENLHFMQKTNKQRDLISVISDVIATVGLLAIFFSSGFRLSYGVVLQRFYWFGFITLGWSWSSLIDWISS